MLRNGKLHSKKHNIILQHLLPLHFIFTITKKRWFNKISHIYNDLDNLHVHKITRTGSILDNNFGNQQNHHFGNQQTGHFREYIPSEHTSRRVYNPDFHFPIPSQQFSRGVSNPPDVHFPKHYARTLNQMQFQQHS